MCAKYGFGEAACFKECKAKQQCVAHRRPYHPKDTVAGGRADALYHHGVDGHAYDNQHSLETNGAQRLEVVLPHAAKLPVGEGGEGDGRKAGEQIDLNKTPVHDDKNDKAYRQRDPLGNKGLHQQTQQRPNI